MVTAHGGMEAWNAAEGFRYTANMYLAVLSATNGRTGADSWRVYTVTLDPHTSHGYVELPLEDGPEPSAGFDGTALWRRDYTFDPRFQDPPFQLLFFHYAMLTLPWLSQQDGVVLTAMERDSLPGYPVLHDVVEMTFEPEGGYHGGAYRLYIDPATHRLRGWRQTAMYPILPGDIFSDSVPAAPFSTTRVVDTWSDVDGLLIPQAYSTAGRNPDGSVRLLSMHLVLSPTLRVRMDPAKATPPEGARVLSDNEP